MKDISAGQYGRLIDFIEDKIDKDFLIQFIGYDDDGDLMFRMDGDNVSKLTISKKCFPIHEWKTGTENNPIKRKTIIEIFESDEKALDYVKWK